MTAARLHALALLSWAFLVMLLKKVFRGGPRGLALFRTNFEVEHLSSIDAIERVELASFSGCIACGLCDLGDGPRMAASQGAYPGTMALMLMSSRNPSDFSAANEGLAWISDRDLGEKEGLCPARVPMRRIAAFIRAHGGLPGSAVIPARDPVVAMRTAL